MTALEILTAALALPEAERLQLADRLYESMAQEHAPDILQDPDFLAMLERRCQDLSNSVPWEEVRRRLAEIVHK